MAGEFFQFAFLAAFAQPLALGVDVALQFGELLQLPLAFQQLSPALPQALALPFEALRGLGAALFQAGFLFPQQPYLLLPGFQAPAVEHGRLAGEKQPLLFGQSPVAVVPLRRLALGVFLRRGANP